MKDLLIEYRKTRLCVLNKIKSLEYKVDEEDKLSIYKDILKDIDSLKALLITSLSTK